MSKLLKNGYYTYNNDNDSVIYISYWGYFYRCKINVTNELEMIKVIHRTKINSSKTSEDEFFDEFDELKKCEVDKNCYCLKPIDLFISKNNLYILTEYCNEGTILDILSKKENKSCSVIDSQKIIFQVSLGLQSQHDNGISHKDIRPENIFIKNGIIKLAGWFSGRLTPAKHFLFDMNAILYYAPEIYQLAKKGFKSDIWAIGCLLYRLLYGKDWVIPTSIIQQTALAIEGKVDIPETPKIPEEVRSVLLGCFDKNPDMRFSVYDLINHQAFDSLKAEYIGKLDESLQKKLFDSVYWELNPGVLEKTGNETGGRVNVKQGLRGAKEVGAKKISGVNVKMMESFLDSMPKGVLASSEIGPKFDMFDMGKRELAESKVFEPKVDIFGFNESKETYDEKIPDNNTQLKAEKENLTNKSDKVERSVNGNIVIQQYEEFQYDSKDQMFSSRFNVIYKGNALKLPTPNEITIRKIPTHILKDINLDKFFADYNKAFTLKNPFLLKHITTILTNTNFYVLSEYCNNGTLRDQIRLKKGKGFCEETAQEILYQICLGYFSLYNQAIVHKDIKPENVFIDNINVYKLGGLPFSKNIKNANKMMSGAFLYNAPEVGPGKIEQENFKADIWSIGCVGYEILCGEPYQFFQKQRTTSLHKLKIPKHVNISNLVENLLEGCLKINQANRYGIKELLNHKAFDFCKDKYQGDLDGELRQAQSIDSPVKPYLPDFHEVEQKKDLYMIPEIDSPLNKDSKTNSNLKSNNEAFDNENYSKRNTIDGIDEFFGVPTEINQIELSLLESELDLQATSYQIERKDSILKKNLVMSSKKIDPKENEE